MFDINPVHKIYFKCHIFYKSHIYWHSFEKKYLSVQEAILLCFSDEKCRATAEKKKQISATYNEREKKTFWSGYFATNTCVVEVSGIQMFTIDEIKFIKKPAGDDIMSAKNIHIYMPLSSSTHFPATINLPFFTHRLIFN